MKLALLATAVLAATVALAGPTVTTKFGPVEGTITQGSQQFLGIPFAAPPTGSLRWKPPQSPSSWSSIRPSKTWSSSVGCPQNCDLPPHECATVSSEDCLFLNVWAPEHATPSSNLPTMVFFPGGRFLVGTANTVGYDGTWLAGNTDTVVVVTNYRLGALGFLYTGADGIDGNFGIMDQQFALQWVQNNIAAFGGSPDQVTIFGESAGGSSVACHLTSPLSHAGDWFHQAIQESNPIGLGFTTTSEGSILAAGFASNLGCSGSSDTGCLMSSSVSDILAAQKKAAQPHFQWTDNLWELFYPWTPTAGTALLPHQPLVAMAQGKAAQVPLLQGHNENEGVMFVAQLPNGGQLDWIEYDATLTALFGVDGMLQVKDMYPSDTAFKSLSAVATDYLFVCPLLYAANHMTDQPIFMYHFNHTFSDPRAVWGTAPDYAVCDEVVCHGAELPFVWNNVQNTLVASNNGGQGWINFSERETYIAQEMATAWADFAHMNWKKSGTVTSTNRVLGHSYAWNEFGQTGEYLMFWNGPNGQATPDTLRNFKSAQCSMFNGIGYNPINLGP